MSLLQYSHELILLDLGLNGGLFALLHDGISLFLNLARAFVVFFQTPEGLIALVLLLPLNPVDVLHLELLGKFLLFTFDVELPLTVGIQLVNLMLLFLKLFQQRPLFTTTEKS